MSLAVAAAMTAKPAQASIVYSGPENVSTADSGSVWFGFTPSTPVSTSSSLSFELFRTSNFRSSILALNASSRIKHIVRTTTAGIDSGNRLALALTSGGFARRLGAGFSVTSYAGAFSNEGIAAETFADFTTTTFGSGSSPRPKPDFGEPSYLALQLPGATPLYGWAEVQFAPNTFDLNLLGFAYQDDGSPIQTGEAPEPASLYLVALGAAGIAAYKKRRRKAAG